MRQKAYKCTVKKVLYCILDAHCSRLSAACTWIFDIPSCVGIKDHLNTHKYSGRKNKKKNKRLRSTLGVPPPPVTYVMFVSPHLWKPQALTYARNSLGDVPIVFVDLCIPFFIFKHEAKWYSVCKAASPPHFFHHLQNVVTVSTPN